MAPPAHRTATTYHPGSTKEDIDNEPDWDNVLGQRIGFRDVHGRLSGVTNQDEDEATLDREFLTVARCKADELKRKAERGDHLTVADYMKNQEVCSLFVFPFLSFGGIHCLDA